MVDSYWELIFRIASLPLAIGLFAASIMLAAIAIGALSGGVPILFVFVFGSVLTMLTSLGLLHYTATGEGAPPWAWWSRE